MPARGLSTHLGNGAAAVLPRHPNFIWAQLADDRLTASFIADGHHLPADTLKSMLRAKGLSRAVLVSDSVALGGMPPGIYEQQIGGRVELSADGRLGIVGTPYLAGAARPLKDGVAMAARSAGLALADALKLATENPGRFVGGRGRLAVGAAADLMRFRWRPGDPTLAIDAGLSTGREGRRGMLKAGVAVVDVTPPAGLAMAGFGARTSPAVGAHDPLTVRAIVVDDTAIVVADVVGMDDAMSRRVRERCPLPAERVIVSALHTHGGPVMSVDRTGGEPDPDYVARLEDACVSAIVQAAASARPAEILVGAGADPDVARNRRHPGGSVDRALPVLVVRGTDGGFIAVVTSYACHPVVLGPDNNLWTADYPHFVRDRLERAYPGATAIFITGCCGDANNGHTAHASLSLAGSPERTYAAAERIGARIADAARRAVLSPAGEGAAVENSDVTLALAWREGMPPRELASKWRAEAAADPTQAAILGYWIRWAEAIADPQPRPWVGRVTAMRWGSVPIVAFPGEIFAETALGIRSILGGRAAFVFSYSDSTPGYIPPASEFAFGGYEVDEAHRYCGMPATFAPGSAEALAAAAEALIERVGLLDP